MHSHYDTLGVLPSADDAVLRRAYRTLMRLYHPDVNKDAEALSRAREITAAYAVLGNRQRRAAYDALLTSGRRRWLPRLRLRMRRLPRGPAWLAPAACLFLAAGVSVGVASWVAVWPELRLPAATRVHPAGAAHPNRAQEATQIAMITAPAEPRHVDAEARPIVEGVFFATDASQRDPITAAAAALPAAQSPQGAATGMPASVTLADTTAPTHAPAPRAAAKCGPGAAGEGSCVDKEQARAELQATTLFAQSMAHADLQKQQLLLSARNRSATARTLCQSGDCVRDAYLQQFRDTVTIMEGGIPRP
jgi:hypothetical protein